MSLANALIGILVLALMVTIGYKVSEVVVELNEPVHPQINSTRFSLPPETFRNETRLIWNHFPLTVYLDTGFLKENDKGYADDFRSAMRNWEISTNNLITFKETSDYADADVIVEWVPVLKESSTDTLGDTEIKFRNISSTGVIQNAHIELLTKSDSLKLNSNDMINLGLHELGHAIGLPHLDNEDMIMYPVLKIPSGNVKQASDNEKQILSDSYKTPARADIRIVEVNVSKSIIKKFTYTYHLLNITILIENNGYVDAPSPVLLIKADDMTVKQETMSDLPIGSKLSIIYGNLQAEDDFSVVRIVMDPENLIEESDEKNNFVLLEVS